MTYRSTWIIHFDEVAIDSKTLRKQIAQIRGVSVVGCTGIKKLEK